jgi:hypothetical protein
MGPLTLKWAMLPAKRAGIAVVPPLERIFISFEAAAASARRLKAPLWIRGPLVD